MDWTAAVASIDNLTYVLQQCRKRKNLAYAKHVHAYIYNNGLESHKAIGNYIVPMFVECGSLSDAQQVFDRLVYRNEHSWTSLMLGYIKIGQPQSALKLYQKMQEDNVQPSSYTLIALLKACARLKDAQRGREIHVEIAGKGLERDAFVGSTLVDMYAKCGSLVEAWEVFDKLPIRDVVTWTALIAGYAEHGPQQEALKCFEQMQLEGVSPDAFTFVSILKACGSIGAIDKGREVHIDIAVKGFERDVLLATTLVDMYAKCRLLAEAQKIFDKLSVRNVMAWNALIAGYAEYGPDEEALKCFEGMQLEGVSPDAVTFVCVLKACGSIGAIDKGREIHIDIAQKGLEEVVYVSNTVVDMYAKCGSLAEAQEVFDKLPVRNVVSWTALIGGYAEHGPAQKALECFEEMQLEDVSPDAITFACILKACGTLGAIDKGREIHNVIAQQGFDRDVFVASTLVDMYARCGAPAEACQVFDKLPVRDVVLWNALISGYAEHGPHQEALQCFEQMQLENISPNASTFSCVLKACGIIGATDKALEMHAHITQKGFERDVFVGNTLVDMYGKFCSLADAQEVFDKLPVRDVVSWTVLIAGYAEHGPAEEALKCFEQMQLEGIFPNDVTIVCVLKACGSIGAIDMVRKIHADIAQNELERVVFIGNALVDIYTKCGSLAEAREVFDKLPTRDVVTWNALLAGYSEHGPCQEVLENFKQMQLEGIFPDSVTFVCILKSCGSIGAVDRGREIHTDIAQMGFERDAFVGSALVDLYAKCGSLVEAQGIFDKLPVRGIVSWNALIAGYAEHGPGQESLNCFEHMKVEGISPDAVTFVCVLKACGNLGAIDKGREVHVDILVKGFESDHSIGSTLVDMYAKCCSVSEAQQVFYKLPVRDVVSWNAMIKGYGMIHEGNKAAECFEDMEQQGVKPNDITFLCLLAACSRAKLVLKGQEFFNMMREAYGIVPTIDHYTCMVDLFAQSGHLDEAVKFVESKPCSPSLMALLSACKIHGEAELGLTCFQQLIQINPEGAAPYVLMAKNYASAGRWDDAYKIEELRKRAGAKKKPGGALIEVNKKVHEFVVGDNESNEISAALETLSSRMKKEGHVPYVNLVLKPVCD